MKLIKIFSSKLSQVQIRSDLAEKKYEIVQQSSSAYSDAIDNLQKLCDEDKAILYKTIKEYNKIKNENNDLKNVNQQLKFENERLCSIIEELKESMMSQNKTFTHNEELSLSGISSLDNGDVIKEHNDCYFYDGDLQSNLEDELISLSSIDKMR